MKNDIMKNRKIKEYKKRLRNILDQKDQKDRTRLIANLANEIGAPVRGAGNISQFIDDAARSIHMVLQTETMLSACSSAKWSCFWAAIAAIVACISVSLTYVQI